MISSDLRTLFVDSVHTRKNSNGSYSLALFEQIGIQPGMVAYVDDLTISGQFSHVNLTNNKVYVLESTPDIFDFTQLVKAKDWAGVEADVAFGMTHAPEGNPFHDWTWNAQLPKTDQNPNGGSVFLKNDDSTNQ